MLFINIISAQNKDTKVADKLFDRFEYVNAINEYLQLTEKGKADSYVYKRLGDCYYNIYNTVEAENWYAKALQSKQDAETYYRYAQILKSNLKYAESNEQMKIFASMKPTDERAIDFNKNPDYLPKLKDIHKLFDIEKIAINSTDKSDFGALLFGDQLYFASSRNENNAVYGWKNEPYLDIYLSSYNEDGSFGSPSLVNELNTKYHEGPVSISKDGNTIYFSSESFNDKLFEKDKLKKLKIGQVNLFKATKVNGKWSKVEPLPFNSSKYSTSNPSISNDGETLYFSSNMPGSIGGIDIWKVTIGADGSYGVPQNLGDKINTVGDESFPFISDDNILYYASNGLIGFGGFDVYSVDLNNNGMPLNIGKPVNSEKDDFAFTFNKEKNIGFLSSNRLGNDHIYSSVPVKSAQILTVVTNAKTQELLTDVKVVILDEFNNVLDNKFTSGVGEVLYDVDTQKSYKLEAYKDGFVYKAISVDKIMEGKVVVNVALEPIDVIVKDGEIVLNPIYFEFDKNNITREGAAELDKLVYVMQQNKNLVISVKSHTDSRGSVKYNENLSERRAISTVQYVISKGISTDRISGKGFGESELKIDCKDCTEEQHAINRRSEFIIVKK
ncbi:OmpA family protein [Flavobacterium sp. NG2]|uniref:OmpA family protein n=1 Tax=Flavobacterium sp. NG2 TaxID=3097547 RepID=UPI002A8167BF|nr:OmpA family protein [Flavobacterium sp. NG2]WPR72636.1 OmpA family protein [Flavobacterium sp. NG2]